MRKSINQDGGRWEKSRRNQTNLISAFSINIGQYCVQLQFDLG